VGRLLAPYRPLSRASSLSIVIVIVITIVVIVKMPIAAFDPASTSQKPSIDGGIPITLAINLLIAAIVWAVYHIIRPRYPQFYYPRIWNEGYLSHDHHEQMSACCCC